MNFGSKDVILGGISIVIVWVLANIIGDYSYRLKEIMCMEMVCTPLVIVVMIILEGIYQFLKWIYKNFNKE